VIECKDLLLSNLIFFPFPFVMLHNTCAVPLVTIILFLYFLSHLHFILRKATQWH